MADDLSILLKVELDKNSGKSIGEQLIEIQDKIGKIDVKVNLDNESMKKILSNFDDVNSKVKNLSKITLFKDDSGKTFRQIDELTNAIGDIERKIFTLNKEGKLELSSTIEVENLKKQKDEYKKILDLIQRVVTAKDKVYENLENQYGFIDIKSLEKVDVSLNGINLDTENLIANYKQVNTEVKNYEKQLKSLENNAIKQREVVDYAQTIQQVKELENAEKQLAKWKEEFQKKNISNIEYERLKQEELARIKSNQIKSQMELNAELDKQNTLEREITLTKQNLNNRLKDITVKNDKYSTDELERLKEAISKVTADTPKAKLELKELSSEITRFGIEAKKSSSTTNAFSDTLKRFLAYFTIHDVIRLGQRAIKEMVVTVFELDKALVGLKKVTDLTGASLKNFTADAYKLGQEISKSGKEVILASTEFAKAGYSDEDLLPLAKSALVLTSIGDGIKDVGESASTIIAVLKGFAKPISDVTNILDTVNNVSNNSAQSFEDITFALQRMSGVMSASNVTMSDSISMFVAINEVLRNAEMSSTALNTISMRIRGLSEDGEAIDGLAPKLQKLYKTITGIDLIDSSGQVKNLTEVTSELSLVWGKLTENEKQYIAQETAGVRQAKAFLTLMGNYNRVLEVNELAYNSAGSAMKEFGKWQDSLEGKMNNLKSAIERFSTNALNSNFIKGIIDATTGLINFADACGGLIPVLISLGTVMTSLKLLSMVKDIDKLVGVSLKLVGVVQSLGTLGTLGITGGIVAGIMAIAYAFNKVKNSAEEALNKTKEKISELNTELSDLNSSKSVFSDLSKEYDKLKDPTGRTTDETKRFYEVQKQLKEILPTISGHYNEQGNFILNTANNTGELNKQMEEYIRLKKEELALNSKTTASATVDKYNEQKKKIEEISQLLNFKNRGFDNLTNDEKRTDTAFGYKYGTDILEITKKLNDAKKEFDEISSQMQSNIFNIIGETEQWTKATDKQKDAIKELMSTKSSDSMARWSKGLSDGTLTVDKFMSTMKKLIPNFNELGDVATESGNDLESEFVSLEKRIEKFNKTSSEMNKLNDILQSLNKNGALTSSEVSSLLEISEDFVSVLGNESALREKLKTTLDDYKEKHRQAYYDMIKDSTEYYNSLINGDVNVYNELLTKLQEYIDSKGLGYKVDLKNYRTIEEAKLDITKDLIKKVAGVWSDYFDSTGNIINSALSAKKKEVNNKRNDDEFSLVDDLGNEASVTNDLSTIYGIYAELQPLLNGVSDEIDNIVLKTLDLKLDSDIGGNSKDDVSKLYNQRIKALEQQIFLSEKLQSTLKEGSKEWQDELDKQNKLIQQQKDLAHDEANRLRGLGYSETSDEVYGKKNDWWGFDDKSIQNSQKTLDGITLTYEEQNQLLEDRLNLLDIEQSKYNTTDSQYKDITQQKYDTILKQEELLQKQIADLYKQGFKDEAKELEKVSVDLYKMKLALAKEFQASEVDTLNQQIDNTEKINNALNTLQKAYINMRKRQLNETKKMYQEEMKYVDEVYNKKKEALQKERDERYKTRELSDKTKTVSDIQAELDLIKNDETQMARRLQLEEELAKAKRELEDFNYDENYNKQMEALEIAQKQAREEYEYRISLLEEQLNDEKWMREQFNKDIQGKSKETYKLLMEDAKKYGDTTTTEIAEAWNICTTSLSTFETKQFDVNRELENMANTLRTIKKLMEEISDMNIETYSSKINIDTKGSNIPKHHSGINAGVVGGSQYTTKSMEQLTKLLKGELVVNTSQADNFMKNVLPNMSGGKEISINQGDIIVQGSVDKDSLSDLKKFVKQSNDSLMKQFKETFSNKGIKPNFKNAY